MGQLGRLLRFADGGHSHWCPGCEEMHLIPDTWTFDGDPEKPTFAPSVKITSKMLEKVDGKWTGRWVRDAAGKPLPYCCHYNLTAGVLTFHGDCTHALRGKNVPLPELPPAHRDP